MMVWIDEPPVEGKASLIWTHAFHDACRSLKSTFLEIWSYKRVLVFLIAFLIYSDGNGTIIKMATTYGREIGINQSSLIMAMLATQFLGLPLTFVYSPLAARFSAKSGLLISLVIYGLISILAYFISTAAHFWALAIMIAFVQGGSQSLSRSIFSG